MNTQMERPSRGHSTTTAHGDQDIIRDHNTTVVSPAGEGHDEGDKKSVLKKVKDKAKKIKNTITGHGHGHGSHDHDEDEDDHDDEMDTDPDVHGTHSAHGITTGREGAGGQHGTNMGQGAAIGSGQVPLSDPGAYQVFDPTTTHYVPGQEETLGWSRTDTGRQPGSENPSHAVKGTYVFVQSSGGAHSTGHFEVAHKPKLGGILEKDPQTLLNVGDVHPLNYQVADPTIGAAAGLLPGQGGTTTRQQGGILGDRGAMEGATHVPISQPVQYKTFDSDPTYVPGQESLGIRSTTETGRAKFSEEQPFAPKNSPLEAHSGGDHVTRAHKSHAKAESAMLADILDRPTTLEKDPHGPRDVGEKRHTENYQSKVTDPTGKGGEEIGVTPILHQLGKMHIDDEPRQRRDANVNTGQQEDLFKPDVDSNQKLSTGSHDQFSPELVTRETSAFVQTPEPQLSSTELSSGGMHNESEHKQGSYTEKISSAASALADKAKQATSSVTSKLGYGSSGDRSVTTTPGSLDGQSVPQYLDKQPMTGPLDEEPVPGGYGETLASISTAVADTAVHAKDVVASKLGYGGAHEGQPEHIDESSKGSSVGEYGKKMASTVKQTIAPVYDKVAGIGSTVASKIHGSGTENPAETTDAHLRGSGTEHSIERAVAPDKGVSVKEYLAEKLKPGEEDKALSEVITEAIPLHKPKERAGAGAGSGGGYGDAKKKVEVEKRVTESEEGRKIEIKGRVTESEEVARRLGRSEETDYDGVGEGVAVAGKSVMDRIYDAAGSWFNKNGEPGDQTEAQDVSGRAQSSISREYEQSRDTGESRLH